jgi:hypothetical protein
LGSTREDRGGNSGRNPKKAAIIRPERAS